MKYSRLSKSKFMEDKVNTCTVYHSCVLCPYYKNNKFPNEDYVGGCNGYHSGYISPSVAMELNDYLNRLIELEDMIDAGYLIMKSDKNMED